MGMSEATARTIYRQKDEIKARGKFMFNGQDPIDSPISEEKNLWNQQFLHIGHILVL